EVLAAAVAVVQGRRTACEAGADVFHLCQALRHLRGRQGAPSAGLRIGQPMAPCPSGDQADAGEVVEQEIERAAGVALLRKAVIQGSTQVAAASRAEEAAG